MAVRMVAGPQRQQDAERVMRKDARADRFETASLALLPGQHVRALVLSHQRWGVIAQIVGYEHLGASIDMIEQFGAQAPTDEELNLLYPTVGAQIDAVVERIWRYSPPAWVRLSIRPRDLEVFQRACDFCGEPTVLDPGGDGLALDVRSNDGPGATTVISHRECLAERIRPESAGEQARALQIGRQEK